jgi:hypothetical protein
VSRDFLLSGFAEEGFACGAGWELLGFLPQSFGFLGKAGFKGLGLFEAATLHDTTSSLRVLTAGFEFREPNMQRSRVQFKSEH